MQKIQQRIGKLRKKKVFLMRGKDSVTEAEDVVQNTYVRLLKYLPDCAKIKNEKAYVFSILHNELYNCMITETHIMIQNFEVKEAIL